MPAQFFTEEQVKAKNWDRLQEARALRERKAVLESEWKKFASSWKEVERFALERMRHKSEDATLRILNPSRNMAVVAEIPWPHLDVDSVRALLSDLEETTVALESIESDMKILGLTFS